jgi:DNA-directed RNA polymerase specialized sigma24 family protein
MSNSPWSEGRAGWAEEACQAACQRVYNRLRGLGLAPAAAAELAADGAQTAFLCAGGRAGFPSCFDSERHLVNWLTVVAYRKGLDELRRARARRLTDSEARQLPAADPPPDAGLVWGCLLRLPAPERQVVLWYYYDRRTDVEIGAALFPGEGTDTALGQRARKVRLAALRRLRRLLLEAGLGPADWGLPDLGEAAGGSGAEVELR